MKIYYAIQMLRVIIMCMGIPDGEEGASRSCSACKGGKGTKIEVVESNWK